VLQPNNRSGQWSPHIAAFGRYWVDTPEGRKRKSVPLGTCATKSIAKKRLREFLDQQGVNDTSTFYQNTAPATTFAEQAAEWMNYMRTRSRKPVKPATLEGWRQTLHNWLLPLIGEVRLAEVGNKTMKDVINKMRQANLAAQSIVTHTRVIKMVVASAVNEEGEQLYPRKWNADFVGMPIIDVSTQHRPSPSKEEVERTITSIIPRFKILVVLLAGAGLRIGEVLGLKVEDLTDDCRVLHVRRSVWGRKEQLPKTSAGVRVVDLAEPLARVLRDYITGKSGLLFATRDGKPLSQRNVRRALLKAGGTCGFHGFRRFRTETLRRERIPEDLRRFWLGHAGASITDLYAQGLREDFNWRQQWAQQIGLGFNLDRSIGVNVVELKIAVNA
jgi:integrase